MTDLARLTLFALGLFAAPLPTQGFPTVRPPDGNPITPEKVLLGKALFWDEQLSSTGTTACGTCHIPGAGGTDPRVAFPVGGRGGTVNPGPDQLFGTPDDRIGSPGVPGNASDGNYRATVFGLSPQVTGRKAPTMINAVFAASLFWDGRASDRFLDPVNGTTVVLSARAALESQAAGPPMSAVEMGHNDVSWTQIQTRLAGLRPLALATDLPAPLAAFVAGRTYQQLFQLAFGTSGVSAARIAMAIATYERTLVSADSRFDRWDGGSNPQWLTAQEVRGFIVFAGPGQCNQCHTAPAFTDDNFHDLGVRPAAEDPGRGGITGRNNDMGRFKTPTLRNVGLQRHFMHYGQLASLAEVVEFYDRGGDFPGAQINPLGLTPQQKADLVVFLHTLTEDAVRDELPPFDRPRLFSESNRVPMEYGHGTAGTGQFPPNAIALEPPLVGSPRWTVGLEQAMGGMPGVLLLDAAPAPGGGFPWLGVQVFLGGTPVIFPAGSVLLAGTGGGQGWGSLVFGLPASPGLVGGSIYLQWLVLDAGGPAGLTASQAVRVTFF